MASTVFESGRYVLSLFHLLSSLVSPVPLLPVQTYLHGPLDISRIEILTSHGNRASEEEVTITRMLEKVLKRSDAVDREALCIVAGQRVRNIFLFLFLPQLFFPLPPPSASRSGVLTCETDERNNLPPPLPPHRFGRSSFRCISCRTKGICWIVRVSRAWLL